MTTSSGIIKHYETIANLGAGGMANVYLALSRGPEGFRKLVVIKKLRTTFADEPEFVQMFREEARLAARLNHPNIVQTLDFGIEDDRYVIVMEYLEGQSLYAMQRRAGPDGLPLANQLGVLTQVLSALQYAHELKDFDGTPLRIVHRDVSPHNVFVTYAGQVKLVDFGIAKALARHQDSTHGGTKGKIGYMAPEQEKGDPLDARTDLFAVGVMLWEALVGRPLWAGLSDIAIISRLHFAEIPAPSEASSEVHPALERICMRALAHRPSDRFDDAAAFRHALDTCMAELGLHAQPEQTGRLVADLFAEDRRKIDRLLNERMTASVTPRAAAPPTNSAPPPLEESTASPSISSHRARPESPRGTRARLAAGFAALAAVATVASLVTSRLASRAPARSPEETVAAPPSASTQEPPAIARTAAGSQPLSLAAELPSGSAAPLSTRLPGPFARRDGGVRTLDAAFEPTTVQPADSAAPTPAADAGVRFEDPWP